MPVPVRAMYSRTSVCHGLYIAVCVETAIRRSLGVDIDFPKRALHIVMAYIVTACIAMAYTVMAYTVMAHEVMAHIVMAYIVESVFPKRALSEQALAVEWYL